jgi:hypothetical protein
MGDVGEEEDLTPEFKLIRNVDNSLGIPESRELPHPTVEEDTKDDDSPPRTAVTKMSLERKDELHTCRLILKRRRGGLRKRPRCKIVRIRRMRMGI